MANEEPAQEPEAAADAESAAARRPKRPAPTIDLTATDITPDPAPAEAAPEATQAAAEAAAAPADAAPGAPAKPAPKAARPAAAPQSRVPSWTHLAAGVAGAAMVLVVLGVLLLIGSIELSGDLTPSPRLAQLEAQLRELAGRPQPPAAKSSPAAATEAAAPATAAPAAADTRAIDELSTRLARAEAALASPPAVAVDPALTARVGTLEAALKTISDNLAALHHQSDDMATGLRETRERGEAAAKALAEIERLGGRIAALERADKSLQDELATKSDRPSDRAVRLAVTASALKSAVERGAPFASELDAARPLAADPALLAPLAAFADAGIPSAAALAHELSALVPALQRQTDTAPGAGGILDRLQASAGRLVQIRPASEAPGDDPPAVIARIEAAAGRADLAAALGELARLPPSARTPADAWINKAQAREAALAAAQKFTAETFAALGKS